MKSTMTTFAVLNIMPADCIHVANGRGVDSMS